MGRGSSARHDQYRNQHTFASSLGVACHSAIDRHCRACVCQKPLLPAHSVALGRACVSSDHAAPEAYARSLLAQDFDIESLYLDTIPEAARLFHDWWEIDDIDFIQVTSGIFRLEELVYSLSAEFVMGLQKPSLPPL